MKRDMRFQLVAVLLTAGAILWLTSSSLTQVQGSNLDESFDFPTSSATLTGSPIAGATPSGFATYHEASSSRELAVTVGVNLAAGTVLNVTVNTVAVGNITLNAAKRGSLSLDTSEGDTVPVIAAGATLAVKNGTATVLSGSFVATPTPTPTATPTPRPSVSPTPTPTPRPSPSPTATPTPRPSPSPTASPTPRPTPGPRFYAPLTGAAIGGVTPNGLGVYGSDDDSPSGMELTVFVGMVNLPAGTLLDVVVGTTTAGQITLRTSGRGEFSTHNAVTIAAGTTLTVKNGTAAILSGTFSTTPPPTPTPTPRPSPTPGPSPSPTPTPGTCTMSLSAATYTVAENAGQLTVTVNRTCTVDGASRVSYETERGTASDRTDYTSTSGRLNFAAGETSKTFSVLITDDTIVESAETFRVELEEARGGSLGTPRQAVVTITDNDVAGTAANPLETARFFVQQHYADFLSRPADEAGLAYWSSQIANCGTNASCLSSKRVAVSAAFFIEQEFGDTGYYIYRMYQASYGRKPLYDEFTPDRASLVGGAELASSKDEFAEDWVQRPAFLSAYPESLVPEQFVNRLFDTAGLYGFSAERQAEINAMYAGRSRAAVLQNVIEVSAFKTREYNPAFVQMQYFGYLRRDPDPAGYDFWLGVVNNRQVNNYHGMVCAFITSAEMQSRFSFNVPRSNNECGQ